MAAITEADGVFQGGGVKGIALAGAMLAFADHGDGFAPDRNPAGPLRVPLPADPLLVVRRIDEGPLPRARADAHDVVEKGGGPGGRAHLG